MNNDYLTAEVVFDRSIVSGVNCDVLTKVARILADFAPAWASTVITWSPNPRERRLVSGGDDATLASLPSVVRQSTRWAVEDRHTGNVELRGATRDLSVVISVNSSPLARVGGKLLLANVVRITGLRKKIAGIPQIDWMRSVFDEICDATVPLWGALFSKSEYRAKVMADGPVRRAVGRDFSRYLPGLFAVNYFGTKYIELIGERKFQHIGATAARKVGNGWIVDVIRDPFTWCESVSVSKNREILSEIGSEYFFLKGNEGTETRAPDWGE